MINYLLDILLNSREPLTAERYTDPLIPSPAEKALPSSDVQNLQAQVDRLTLINIAMWTLLRDKLGVNDEDLRQRVEAVDLSDGRLDGKIRGTVRKCSACNRTVSTKHARCLYCGHASEEGSEYAMFTSTMTPPVDGANTSAESDTRQPTVIKRVKLDEGRHPRQE